MEIEKTYKKHCICGKGWNYGRKKAHLEGSYHFKWTLDEYKKDVEKWNQKMKEREENQN
jgi:hypothetical protein